MEQDHEVVAELADGRARILINGHDIASIAARLMITMTAGDRPVMTVDLAPHVVRAVLDGHVVLADDAARRALISLGWTPPPEVRE